MVIATSYCLPRLLRWFCISSYCLLSLWGLYKVSRPPRPALTNRRFPGHDRVVSVGAAPVLPAAVHHAPPAVVPARDQLRRRRSRRLSARRPAGRRVHFRRRHRGHARAREVVSWRRGLLPKLPQHHARAGGGGGVLHARGYHEGPGVDVTCHLQRGPLISSTRFRLRTFQGAHSFGLFFNMRILSGLELGRPEFLPRREAPVHFEFLKFSSYCDRGFRDFRDFSVFK